MKVMLVQFFMKLGSRSRTSRLIYSFFKLVNVSSPRWDIGLMHLKIE